jgi:16S rRNA processing protein RimM
MAPGVFLALGRVIKTHGLNGEVSVEPYSGIDLTALTGVEVWFVPPPASTRSATVKGVRPGPKGPLLRLSTVHDIDAAKALTGTEMMARADDVPEDAIVEEEESVELLGFTVTDTVHGLLGEIVEVIVTGANDVWVVDGPLGEVLLPVIDDVVLAVDFDARSASVRLLPGLLPEDSE